jgi:hypothetical protein
MDLEAAAEKTGILFAIVQSEASRRATSHGESVTDRSIVPIVKRTGAPHKPLSLHPKRPLEGIQVLCATHAAAGPSAGRTLPEHGATVLQVMYIHGFEHSFVYT